MKECINKEKKYIELGERDAYLLFRSNETVELYIPSMKEGDTVPTHITALVSIACACINEDYGARVKAILAAAFNYEETNDTIRKNYS